MSPARANLLDNAATHSVELEHLIRVPRILIRHGQIIVEDDGPGVEAADRPRPPPARKEGVSAHSRRARWSVMAETDAAA